MSKYVFGQFSRTSNSCKLGSLSLWNHQNSFTEIYLLSTFLFITSLLVFLCWGVRNKKLLVLLFEKCFYCTGQIEKRGFIKLNIKIFTTEEIWQLLTLFVKNKQLRILFVRLILCSLLYLVCFDIILFEKKFKKHRSS